VNSPLDPAINALPELHEKIRDILGRHNNMTIATLRPDGFPQATTVGYANNGTLIYFGCGVASQKARNIAHDPRVSAAIDKDHDDWSQIEGLSLAGRAARVSDPEELAKVAALFLAKFPQVAAFSPDDRAATAIYRITPTVISVLDYSKGFGHSDLVTL
jgi:nitroimidazol reductase NimA-like FMN-containing flavoprotein (pyridoxamine 5'-phosphate oxidase superfamily)